VLISVLAMITIWLLTPGFTWLRDAMGIRSEYKYVVLFSSFVSITLVHMGYHEYKD
jgi:hypothetical protein